MITQPYIIHYNTTLHYTLSQSNTPSPQAPISVQVRTHLVKIKCLLNGTQFGTFLEAFLAPTPEPGLVPGLGTMLGQSLTVARNSNFVKYFVMTVSSAPRSGDCQNSEHLYSLLYSPLPSPAPANMMYWHCCCWRQKTDPTHAAAILLWWGRWHVICEIWAKTWQGTAPALAA